MNLYEEWESLESEEKYPPEEFFRDIYDECQKQGAEITFPVDEVIEKYRRKGNRKEYQERQTGLEEW